MGGCFGFNGVSFALKRVGNFLQWWGLESRFVHLDNDTTMHCWVPAHKNTKQSRSIASHDKPALVLLHAFGSFGLSWCMQVPQFSKNYNLYIPDLVFFGESTSKSSERSEFFQADCVVKLLQQLKVDKFSVIGTSYGGFVAYRLAHMYPQAVHKVVLSSSGVCMGPTSDERLVKECGVKSIKEILVPVDVEGVRRILNLAFYRLPFPILDYFCQEYLEIAYKDGTNTQLELVDGLVLGKPGSPELPKILQEALVIWGDKDRIFNLDLAYQLKEHIGKRAQIAVIKDTAHTPQAEKYSEYNETVMSFLKSTDLQMLAEDN
ncbi:hypothetical protein O6H91_11G035100 [Diphasiastrum complanatum]|uniref:Uncharacterized protein n=1 Tax=Diphasiastrum complanatum TaxID=34168 RepID=A0ACC2C7U7_DIPCM|nr:hypothetical protein O6H91_11G035100 [Diphasiastrum complanatum]